MLVIKRSRYVSFFANNGTRTTEEVRVLANSCASTLRYLENRDDFNFLKTSRIRMGYEDGEVTLEASRLLFEITITQQYPCLGKFTNGH